MSIIKRIILTLTSVLMFSSIVKANNYDAAIIVDADTGLVLHSEKANENNYPASLTKMMTLYITFDALNKGILNLDQELIISKIASLKPATKMYLQAGEKISVEEAIKGLIVKSANDAATVLSENLSGSEGDFAKLMTKTAKQIGMTNTIFKNASGLSNFEQVSSAKDMALLSLALYKHFPEYYHYFNTRSFSYNGKTFYSHNAILTKYDGADGFKTGYIKASGYNLVASAHKKGKRIIAVLLGSQNPQKRDEEMIDLLDYGFVKLQKDPKLAGYLENYSNWKSGTSKRFTSKSQPKQISNKYNYVEDVVAKSTKYNNGNWGVQVGAFETERQAKNMAYTSKHKIRELGRFSVAVQKITKGHKNIYRSRLYGMNQVKAAKACNMLKRKGIDCFTTRNHTKQYSMK